MTISLRCEAERISYIMEKVIPAFGRLASIGQAGKRKEAFI